VKEKERLVMAGRLAPTGEEPRACVDYVR
jgi:hypothetical protein